MSKPKPGQIDAIIKRLEARHKKAALDVKATAKLASAWRRLRAKRSKSSPEK